MSQASEKNLSTSGPGDVLEVVSVPTFKSTFAVILCFILAAAFGLPVILPLGMLGTLLGGVGIATFGLAGLIALWLRLKHHPLVTITSDGIESHLSDDTSGWRWSDVGPFTADYQSGRFGIGTNHSVCAFDADRYNANLRNGVVAIPTVADADIIIDLHMSAVGKSADTAQAFASRLNAWREQYGPPDILLD